MTLYEIDNHKVPTHIIVHVDDDSAGSTSAASYPAAAPDSRGDRCHQRFLGRGRGEQWLGRLHRADGVRTDAGTEQGNK